MRSKFLLIAVALVTGCASVRHDAPPSLHAATPASKAEVARYAEHLLAENYSTTGRARR